MPPPPDAPELIRANGYGFTYGSAFSRTGLLDSYDAVVDACC